MSLTLLIIIGITIVNIIVLVIFVGRDNADGAMSSLVSLFVVVTVGFGLICGVLPIYSGYTQLAPTEVEYKFYENSSKIIMVYDNRIYSSTSIKDLNAINNLDYFVLEEDNNAYGGTMQKHLHIVEKGKVDDYIEKALK